MLNEWYKENPGKMWNGKRFNYRDPKNYESLSELQKAHLRGEINLYEPLENYSVKWAHKTEKKGMFLNAYPIEETRTRADLPSIAVQWKQDFKKRNKNG